MSGVQKLHWHLEWYNREGDDLIVGKLHVPQIGMEDARSVVGAPESDPMVGGFELDESSAEKLKRFVELEFDFQRYVYFLGAVDPS